ncbi:MAG: hypothetical protein NTZ27_04045 [Ignavibacteriales bacterium]|nr:hypothetical protein [Ignavibacteriales bacterium]
MFNTPAMERLNTAYLLFEYEYEGVKITARCLGMTLGSEEKKDGRWFLNDEAGKYWDMGSPKEEIDDWYVEFLFPIPLKVKNGILKYEDKVLIEKVKIK